jgi:hypothetical protein
MNDNDVPDMPDRPEIKITADDYAKLRELSKTSDITHCIRCLATSPGGGDPGRGVGGFRNSRRRYARDSYRLREAARRRYALGWAPFKEAR